MDEKKKEQQKDQEADKKLAERRKGHVLARRTRRAKTRAQAKANGHKLGSKNKKCKHCGILQVSEDFATNCLGKS